MCGIAGVLGHWPGLSPEEFRHDAYARLRHRGPDSRGACRLGERDAQPCNEGPIAAGGDGLLVHTRLAILDVTACGAQPMRATDAAAVLVFNGEIYNFRELRATLGGAPLRGSGDTAVLLEWLRGGGGERLRELNGMFAFAHVDMERGQFLIARDALGIKPLYFAKRDGALAFASELSVLLTLPGVGRGIDTGRALQALTQGYLAPCEQTIFSNIEELRPGEQLRGEIHAPHRARREMWYELPAEATFLGGFEDAKDALKEEFTRSVRYHMRSDVPIGFAVSGGLDSSAIALTARQVVGPDADLRGISFIARDAALSEERWVDIASATGQLQVNKVVSGEADVTRDLDCYVMTHGEPQVGISAYAEYNVYRRVRELGLKVMLDGQGPDEMMGGYNSYMSTYLHELLLRGRWTEIARLLRTPQVRARASTSQYLRQIAATLVPTELVQKVRGLFGDPIYAPWLALQDYRVQISGLVEEERAGMRGGLWSHLRRSTRTSLVAQFRQTDRNAMRFSVENRVPFASRAMADLVFSFPSRFFVGPQGQTKYLLREAMRGTVPDQIIDRRDKIGFAHDEAMLLRESLEWATDVLQSAQCPLINTTLLREAHRQFVAGAPTNIAGMWTSLLFLRWWQLNKVTA